jgi:membrane associated rhomboid family serine protease
MGRETFVLLFVLASAALAVWVAVCLPRLAPRSLRSASVHLGAALVVGALLGPVSRAVPGRPSTISVLAALFLVALPVLTYMFLTGMWLVQRAVGESLAHRR